METQVPFTGGSGRILDLAFEAAGMQKSDIFITNVVHCHPPNNRKSLSNEIVNCSPFLFEEIDIIKPTTIIPLGQDAIVSVLGPDVWPAFVGKRIEKNNCNIYPMYHPSYIMKKGKKTISNYAAVLASILINARKT